MNLELGVWDLEHQLSGLQRGRHYALECDAALAVCASVNGFCLEKIELDYEKRKKEREEKKQRCFSVSVTCVLLSAILSVVKLVRRSGVGRSMSGWSGTGR
jgi:hypothetical protein